MRLFPGTGGLGWRRALKSDVPALSAFLQADETRRVGFSGRLLAEEGGAAPALRLPIALRGAVWISGASAITGAVLCHPSRLVFPIFPEDGEGDRGLALLAGPFAPASVIGMAGDVARYESLLGLEPKASVAYRLMTRAGGSRAAPPAAYPGLSLRRASIADLDALMYLQEAYEVEEVLTPVHEFNRAACRASLARALERQLVFVAVEEGIFVGKAGTNARGFRVDQVGGVYTLPERRGRGVAAALMAALLAEIGSSFKRPALFVKPTNAAARALYRGLGFEDVGDYRADYFEA
jgi:ribosomal protein S18 acetylase RimI-like enzyme